MDEEKDTSSFTSNFKHLKIGKKNIFLPREWNVTSMLKQNGFVKNKKIMYLVMH